MTCAQTHLNKQAGIRIGMSAPVEAGCSAFNVILCAEDRETAVTAVAEVRRLLGAPATHEHLFI
jgi:hypothetical protein